MAFKTSVSGLRAASANLDVTGNNIANANTVGFKRSRAEFADVYAVSELYVSFEYDANINEDILPNLELPAYINPRGVRQGCTCPH